MVGGDAGLTIQNVGNQAAVASSQLQDGNADQALNSVGLAAGQAVGGNAGQQIQAGV